MDSHSQNQIATLHPDWRAAVTSAWNEAEAAVNSSTKILIVQGYRPMAESDKLFQLGRSVRNPDGYDKIKKPMGNIVTNSPGGRSYHNYGLAFDFQMLTNGKLDYVVGPQWLIVVKIMEAHGMTWGGNFPTILDDPHFENKFGFNWRQLLTKYEAKDFLPGTQYVNLKK